MSRNNLDLGHLSGRDKELVALGASIASNCIPCVEYHIPQARKAGLSDLEIGEAVALADKVRRVPADKVLQTASALLERQMGARVSESDACGCPDNARGSRLGTAGEADEPHVNDVRLDNEGSGGDNEKNKKCCDDVKDSTRAQSPDEAAAGSRGAEDCTGFDFSRMMEMMRGCCPDKTKDLSSMMSDFEKGCCSPNEDTDSEGPV